MTISKTQVISDCANAYRTASGTTDSVKFGELANKISNLTCSSNVGYQPIWIDVNIYTYTNGGTYNG